MDMLCSVSASACILGIIFSVINNMTPSEKFSRQMNIIFSLILILVIFSPFAKGDFKLDMSDISENIPEDYSYIYNEQTGRLISANISDNLGQALSEKGIFPLKISVDINNSADSSISIIGAEIILADRSDSKAAAKTAAEALGVDRSLIIVKTEDKDNGTS
ncbi:MAG: hypothetical protein PUI48_04550 [Oscillospiraceae bacterium]|nr:hypothetical protein [Oscillospiraceae bacterium]MDY6207869.1 hypothetical protein [Oscillospiraceae bacterium]